MSFRHRVLNRYLEKVATYFPEVGSEGLISYPVNPERVARRESHLRKTKNIVQRKINKDRLHATMSGLFGGSMVGLASNAVLPKKWRTPIALGLGTLSGAGIGAAKYHLGNSEREGVKHRLAVAKRDLQRAKTPTKMAPAEWARVAPLDKEHPDLNYDRGPYHWAKTELYPTLSSAEKRKFDKQEQAFLKHIPESAKAEIRRQLKQKTKDRLALALRQSMTEAELDKRSNILQKQAGWFDKKLDPRPTTEELDEAFEAVEDNDIITKIRNKEPLSVDEKAALAGAGSLFGGLGLLGFKGKNLTLDKLYDKGGQLARAMKIPKEKIPSLNLGVGWRGNFYNSLNHSVSARTLPFLSHELGHAKHRNSLLQKIDSKVRPITSATYGIVPMFAGMAAGAAAPEKATKYLAGASAALWAPTLLEEGRATLTGLRALKKLKIGKKAYAKAALGLLGAFGTYASGAILSASAPYAGREMKDFDEKIHKYISDKREKNSG